MTAPDDDQQELQDLWRASPITVAAERLFYYASRVSLVPWLFKTRQTMNAQALGVAHYEATRRRSRQIDLYVMSWIMVEVGLGSTIHLMPTYLRVVGRH